MNALDQLARVLGYERPEKRSSLENPQTPLSYPAEWLLDAWNGGRTDSGIRVSELTALQVSTVTACVNIIANGVSSLPLHVYEKLLSDGRMGKKIAHGHPLLHLLHTEPNFEMSSVTWRKTAQAHALLWGNSFTEIQRNEDNEIIALWPHNPARTRPIRILQGIEVEGDYYPAGSLFFECQESMMGSQISPTDSIDDNLLQRRLVLAEDMIHIPGLSLDGRLGQPVVQNSRNVIGLSLATEKYGAKFFANQARPAGILEIPNALSDIARENLKRSWAEAHGGENVHKVAVLEQGVKFTKVGSTPEEGQYLQTREYQVKEVARIFGVPGHMIGDVEKSAGKSTVEQSSIEFVLYCLNPWLSVWEAELKRKLFPTVGRNAGKFFAKFDSRKLMYPDAASRSTFYANGRQWGYLNADDIRELEDMNPVGDKTGTRFWMPVNEQYADDPITLGNQAKYDFQQAHPEAKPTEPKPEEVAQ